MFEEELEVGYLKVVEEPQQILTLQQLDGNVSFSGRCEVESILRERERRGNASALSPPTIVFKGQTRPL